MGDSTMNFSLDSKGFTLIELMIALVIGLILVLGISTIFVGTTNNIRLQRGLANIQDSGRIASDFLRADIGEAGALYGSSLNIEVGSNGRPLRRPVTSFVIGAGRGLMSNDEDNKSMQTGATASDQGLAYGIPNNLALTAVTNSLPNAYRISSRFMISGHECSTDPNCVPALTVMGAGRTETGANAAPPVGAGVGGRVAGTDVLTVRRLVGNGASIASLNVVANRMIYTLQPNSFIRLGLNSLTARHARRLVMIADVDKTALFAGFFNEANNTFEIAQALNNDPGMITFSASQNAKLFDVENQFFTVTYFVAFVNDPNIAGRLIPALMRRENGRALEEVVRGVERLDFRYKIGASREQARWLDASELNASTAACPPAALDTFEPVAACQFGDVTEIEAAFLANTIDDIQLPDRTTTYTMEGENNVTATGNTLRREFRFTIPLKAWLY
jgi:type IV pilus assembly protein PilW